MSHADLIKLTQLMTYTTGDPAVSIGVIDGPIMPHPDLAIDPAQLSTERGVRALDDVAYEHGTFVMGVLAARRGSGAPAICPGCTFLTRSIYNDGTLSTTTTALASAVVDCIRDGARIINLSLGVTHACAEGKQALTHALELAAKKHVLVIAAAGNQQTLGSSVVTGHPWVIPVVAYEQTGRPTGLSNLGRSIGRSGIGAPGDRVTSLGTRSNRAIKSGTSVAAPFVTGTAALLWSAFPWATAAQVKLAILARDATRRSVIPPLLDAARAYHRLQKRESNGTTHS